MQLSKSDDDDDEDGDEAITGLILARKVHELIALKRSVMESRSIRGAGGGEGEGGGVVVAAAVGHVVGAALTWWGYVSIVIVIAPAAPS